MRKIVAAFAACVATSAAADLVASNGKDELRLFQQPCENPVVLALLNPEYHSQFQRALALVGGKRYAACWIDTGEGAYFVAYDDGDMQAIPITAFISQPGV